MTDRRRRSPGQRGRTGGPAVVACVLLAACATSSTSTTSATSAAPATSPVPAGTTPASADQLSQILLQPSDLPAGWTGKAPSSPTQPEVAARSAFVACVGGKDTSSDQVASARSQDFHQGDATISSSARSYRSQSDVQADVATVTSPKVDSCYGQLLQQQLAPVLSPGTTIAGSSVQITPGANGGPSNVAATGTATLTLAQGGQQSTMYVGLAVITGPLLVAEVTSDDVGAPVPASVQTAAVSAVAGRAAGG